MKWLRWLIRLIVFVFLLALLYVGGMIVYAMLTDYDPPPTETLTMEGKARDSLLTVVQPDTLSLYNWNIGFTGLGKESDFFYDGGDQVIMPEALVDKNRTGIMAEIAVQAKETDFFLLQEVDRHSRRSYYVDGVEAISAVLPGFVSSYATNYRVGFIPIPFTRPMGTVEGGLATWSRFQPDEAMRYSFEGNYDWPTYLFFLDRCFLLTRFTRANHPDLVLINTHNSAYDDGSLKKRQMEQMQKVLLAEYEKGNYVIVGGDWNQFPPHYQGVEGFALNEQSWSTPVAEDYPAAGWQWAYDPSLATNRSLNAPFDADTTRRYIIDYFLLSPNVELLKVKTADLGFAYSDHQPVRLQVVLGSEALSSDHNLALPDS